MEEGRVKFRVLLYRFLTGNQRAIVNSLEKSFTKIICILDIVRHYLKYIIYDKYTFSLSHDVARRDIRKIYSRGISVSTLSRHEIRRGLRLSQREHTTAGDTRATSCRNIGKRSAQQPTYQGRKNVQRIRRPRRVSRAREERKGGGGTLEKQS